GWLEKWQKGELIWRFPRNRVGGPGAVFGERVTFCPAVGPRAVFELPVTNAPAATPTATFSRPLTVRPALFPMAVFKLFAGLAPVPALAPTAVHWAPTAVAFVPHAIEPAPVAVAPSPVWASAPVALPPQTNCARALGGAAISARVAEKMT